MEWNVVGNRNRKPIEARLCLLHGRSNRAHSSFSLLEPTFQCAARKCAVRVVERPSSYAEYRSNGIEDYSTGELSIGDDESLNCLDIFIRIPFKERGGEK